MRASQRHSHRCRSGWTHTRRVRSLEQRAADRCTPHTGCGKLFIVYHPYRDTLGATSWPKESQIVLKAKMYEMEKNAIKEKRGGKNIFCNFKIFFNLVGYGYFQNSSCISTKKVTLLILNFTQKFAVLRLIPEMLYLMASALI
jgi:hypothetical protein